MTLGSFYSWHEKKGWMKLGQSWLVQYHVFTSALGLRLINDVVSILCIVILEKPLQESLLNAVILGNHPWWREEHSSALEEMMIKALPKHVPWCQFWLWLLLLHMIKQSARRHLIFLMDNNYCLDSRLSSKPFEKWWPRMRSSVFVAASLCGKKRLCWQTNVSCFLLQQYQ